MANTKFDRRRALAAGAVIATGTVFAAGAGADTVPLPPTVPAYKPAPLPFDPNSVPGLSAKLLTSHHDNNYRGAVKRLGAIQGQLAALDPTTAANFTLNGLKREELIAWNSMILHEIYFSGIGAPNRPGTKLSGAIEASFGSEQRWRSEFVAMGKALGGGSGWVILTYSPHDGRLTNQWAADHTMAFAGGVPLLVLDMYEHAYALDYGAKAGDYVDAFMGVVNWTTADGRFARMAA